MISFWRIFWLEILSLTRSRTVVLLMVACLGWMLALPAIVRSDGTAEGAWRLYVQYSLGGVFALSVVALLASATGSVARERAAKRLQLTLVRPVRYSAVAFGKILAHVTVGALVLALSCAILFHKADAARRCNHVLSPVLPSPREEARTMYEAYMSDPATPDAVRRARKDVVVRLLTQRAVDRYETIGTNEVAKWTFVFPAATRSVPSDSGTFAVRMRFTNQMELRQDVRGAFRLGGMFAAVSNMTQAVVEVPLVGAAEELPARAELSFSNCGTSPLMLRPRKDLNVLVPADSFGWNLLRAYLGMVAVLALVVSAGIFLSCALGRPVAMFVAFVVLIVGEMSPSVIEQYPDELEADPFDRIGLCVSRFAAEVTRPVSSLQPLAALAEDECVEPRAVAKTLFADLVVLPLAFALLSALVLPRKQDDLV